ncbi:MAG: DUF2089 domain-containing protein [Treponemataceae bacterium]
MKKKIISTCPICNNRLVVTKLHCNSCSTTIEGEFNLLEFYALSDEQLNFVRCFLRNRGNIKDVEKELGISYPTVRAKLDDALITLNIVSENKEEISKKNTETLNKLKVGEISVDEALEMILN